MKLLIASDIHGSAVYSEQLLAACGSEKPDRILLLGDILYHGPRNALPTDYDTKRTAAILNSLRDSITAVRGNCDAEVDQMVLDFPVMNTCEIVEADGIRIFAAHGHNYSPENLPPFARFNVLATGHTHVPVLKRYDGFVHINPGSVSIPKQGSRHSYMTLSGGRFALKALDTREELDSLIL